jgi:preprotein translocase subunit SecY
MYLLNLERTGTRRTCFLPARNGDTLFFIFMLTIFLVQGTRRIPVQYAKRIVGNKQYGGVRQYIPLKVNAAGVMPIIFAQAFVMIPITLAGFASSDSMSAFASAFANFQGFGTILLCILIIFLHIFILLLPLIRFKWLRI